MSLSGRQQMFTEHIAMLINYASSNGYGLTFGDAYRDPRVFGKFGETKPESYAAINSVHKVRLAVDFNVFKNGKYLTGEESKNAHSFLHDYWDSLGGAKRIDEDLNHYSFDYGEYR